MGWASRGGKGSVLIDAKHKPWLWAVVGLTVAATAVYIPYHVLAPNGPSGSSLSISLTSIGGDSAIVGTW